MANVFIYPPDCVNFDNNGLGALMPLETTVREIGRGMYELELVHPIDRLHRWRLIENMCIVKAMCPVRESPDNDTKINPVMPTTITRELYTPTTKGKSYRYIRSKPSTTHTHGGSNSAVIGSAEYGKNVIVLEKTDATWWKVQASDGTSGYMQARYLKFVKTVDQTVTSKYQPVSRDILAPDMARNQLFRIYSTEVDTEHMTITAKALHITYDLRLIPVVGSFDFEDDEAKGALDACWMGLADSHMFALNASEISGSVTGDFSYKNAIEVLLDPDEGFAAQTGSIVYRDNFDIYLLPEAEQNHGVTIRRGKNLIGVTATSDNKDLVTRIIPIGTDSKDKDLIADPVDSPHIDEWPMPCIKAVKYKAKIGDDGIRNEKQLRQKLAELAQEDFDKGCDMPEYSLEVDFVTLGDSVRGTDYEKLQAVFLYDDVTVIDELIGLKATVKVVEYEWDALALRYNKIKLGDLGDVEQSVFSYNMPDAKISGRKLQPNSAAGSVLRDLSVAYGKFTNAAIDQLNANTITAYRADIEKIAAREITADSVVAALATINAIHVGALTADSIRTDELAAALAKFSVITAGAAEFDRETVRHLVSELLNVQEAVGGRVFISNLTADYANLLQANVGSLVVGASDGSFYRLDVDSVGNVTAVPTEVTAGERAAGKTGTGKTILETEIAASDLSATNFKAVSALINRLDAARIDVAQLTAQKAYIDHLHTADISDNESIRIAIEAGENTARYMKFDEDGLIQKVPGHVYYTRVDNDGFDVCSELEVDPIATMNAVDGIRIKRVTLGNIICKQTGSGGWVWQEQEE